MQKTYTSHTEVSFHVLINNHYVHVTFMPHTLGGSSLTTDDIRLQEAIEAHRFFGTRVVLGSVAGQQETAYPQTRHEIAENHGKTAGMAEKQNPLELHFSSLSDAKDHIANTWGISRTMLRCRAQMETVALEHGVKLIID